MPIIAPTIDSTGFNIPTLTDVLDSIISAEQQIYGSDTNYDTNSPDGQRVLLLAQGLIDSYEAQLSLFNSHFANYAIGNALDLCVSRKGIARKAGTFSTINIQVTTNSICTLNGLDADYNNINGTGYTVQDSVGNKWILIATTTLAANSVNSLQFRSATYGANISAANTITIPVNIVVGVTNVTNLLSNLTTGTSEELDSELRQRYFASFAVTASNQVDAVYSQLLNLSGVTDVLTQQNNTSATDIYGTDPFTLWTIIEGGVDTEIASILYRNIHGAGMRGAVTVTIPSVNGVTSIVVKFDRPYYTRLYIKFNLQRAKTTTTYVIADIQTYIANNTNYKLGDNADSGTLTSTALDAITALGGGAVPLDLQISIDGTTWVDYLTPITLQYVFTLTASDIAITVL